MADVFISYSQKDRETAKVLAEFLTECGYDLWWDYELVGGIKFRNEIRSRLDAAKAAIVIWTPNSVKSDWVIEEAEEAKLAKKLIATRIVELDYRNIPLGFRSVHTELVSEPDRILKALETIAVRPSRPPSKRRFMTADQRLDPLSHSQGRAVRSLGFHQGQRRPQAFVNYINLFPASSFAGLAQTQLGKFAADAWKALRDKTTSKRSRLSRPRSPSVRAQPRPQSISSACKCALKKQLHEPRSRTRLISRQSRRTCRNFPM